jgi:hypothetical protein
MPLTSDKLGAHQTPENSGHIKVSGLAGAIQRHRVARQRLHDDEVISSLV